MKNDMKTRVALEAALLGIAKNVDKGLKAMLDAISLNLDNEYKKCQTLAKIHTGGGYLGKNTSMGKKIAENLDNQTKSLYEPGDHAPKSAPKKRK